MNMGIIKTLKTLYRARLVNYVLEATEESLLTSSSKASEVSAKVNVLQAVSFMADSWRKVSSETIQNCFSHYGFKHLILEMDVDMIIESENDDEHVELYKIAKNFCPLTTSFNATMKMEITTLQSLLELQQNTRQHRKTKKTILPIITLDIGKPGP
ncbi:hypothetical protein X975_13385, partial [Stegodyphus mimosarum]